MRIGLSDKDQTNIKDAFSTLGNVCGNMWDQLFDDKSEEEIQELKDAIVSGKGINEELGDVLFTIVNLSRHLNLNPEKSLRLSIKKFSNRFKKIEKKLKSKNINMKDLSLEELDEIWNKNKELSNE